MGGAVAVECPSALNRVCGEAAYGFRWSLAPYRGCAHAALPG